MRTRVLTVRYVGALLVVAGLLVAGQTVIHQVMARQEGDARVINLAGRQRMLGQRLCALTLALDVDPGSIGASLAMRDELARTADDWERSQAMLRAGRLDGGLHGANSVIVDQLFGQIDVDHRAMLAAARAAIARSPGELALADARTACVHQESFLAGMDRIVTQYEREARRRIAGLRRLELVLLGLALLVLALEGVFVFRPAVRDLQMHFAEHDLVQRALEASEAEKQAILRALSERLLVWSRGDGCAELTADRAAGSPPRRLAELVPAELAAACLERTDQVLATGEVFRARVRAEHRDHDARLLRLDDDRLLIAIRDVTEVARLEQALLDITDREQARLAQDLHDGLGQQLIGASFLLRPLRQQLGAGPVAAKLDEKLGEIDHMLRDAIAQTRDLVRSLHSPTLEAAGLAAALGELAAHIARVFGIECRLHDRAGLDPPAQSRVQLHRIAREAVVNAAKHASATVIDIELDRDVGGLTLVVRDDGVGIAARPPIGMGLHLMAYRARLLGGSLEVSAGPGRGTIVICRVPLRALATAEASP